MYKWHEDRLTIERVALAPSIYILRSAVLPIDFSSSIRTGFDALEGETSHVKTRTLKMNRAIHRMYFLPAIAAVANQSACPYSIPSSNAYLVIETLQPLGLDDAVEPNPKQPDYVLR